MPAPQSTYNALGNIRAAASLAAAATASYSWATVSALDLSTAWAGRLTAVAQFGSSVAATSGLQIQCYPQYSSTSATFATIPWITYVIPAVANQTGSVTLELPTGRWQVVLTNLDASNAITNVSLTLDTIPVVQ